MSKRKVYLRADAGSGIGYGHFIRTLALADMLKDDFECTFFTASPTSYQIGEMEKVCAYFSLQQEDKFHEFLSYLKGDEIVVLDNYFFTTDYQKRIKSKGCVLVCIDDMHDKHYVADLIINQGIGYTSDDYSCEPYTRFAFGLHYSLLRRPFFEASAKKGLTSQNNGMKVLVAFGGSDYLNLTSQVIHEIITKDTIQEIIAIIGDSYNADYKIDNPKVIYKKNLSAVEIADLFMAVDVAILPASTMMNEALACGTQIIGGYYVDNQEYDYYMFLREGLILSGGDFTEPRTFSIVANQVDRIATRRKHTISSDTPTRFVNLFKSL